MWWLALFGFDVGFVVLMSFSGGFCWFFGFLMVNHGDAVVVVRFKFVWF